MLATAVSRLTESGKKLTIRWITSSTALSGQLAPAVIAIRTGPPFLPRAGNQSGDSMTRFSCKSKCRIAVLPNTSFASLM